MTAFRRYLVLFWLLSPALAPVAAGNDPTEVTWSGRFDGEIAASIRISRLDEGRYEVQFHRGEISFFEMPARSFSREVTVPGNARLFLEWTDGDGNEQEDFRFTFDPQNDFFRGEFTIQSFTMTGIFRRPGDTRLYQPDLAPAAAPPPASLADLPSSEDWIRHVKKDLAPFWMHLDALGDPPGAFPTVRCNDGALFDLADPCLDQTDMVLGGAVGQNYVRAISRQAFGYGVIFHLTGDLEALERARLGVEFLRRHAMDPQGGAFLYFDQGQPDGERLARTGQDQAYALMGLAFYYYLTRDTAVLEDIKAFKSWIFDSYYSDRLGMVSWLPSETGDPSKFLVSQLDQINAYMLMLLPVLPEPVQSEWKRDADSLVNIMLDNFLDRKDSRFWGFIHEPAGKAIGANFSDFGHTVKTWWMIHQYARIAGDPEMEARAFAGLEKTLALAWLPGADGIPGKWGYGFDSFGRRAASDVWWVFAELDQAAATAALKNPAHINYLAPAYDRWLNSFVDPVHGEVWAFLSPDGNGVGAKISQWKSAFHSLEHALVAYLTTRAMEQEPVELWFAFDGPPAAYVPYIIQGDVVAREVQQESGNADIMKVSFRVKAVGKALK